MSQNSNIKKENKYTHFYNNINNYYLNNGSPENNANIIESFLDSLNDISNRVHLISPFISKACQENYSNLNINNITKENVNDFFLTKEFHQFHTLCSNLNPQNRSAERKEYFIKYLRDVIIKLDIKAPLFINYLPKNNAIDSSTFKRWLSENKEPKTKTEPLSPISHTNPASSHPGSTSSSSLVIPLSKRNDNYHLKDNNIIESLLDSFNDISNRVNLLSPLIKEALDKYSNIDINSITKDNVNDFFLTKEFYQFYNLCSNLNPQNRSVERKEYFLNHLKETVLKLDIKASLFISYLPKNNSIDSSTYNRWLSDSKESKSKNTQESSSSSSTVPLVTTPTPPLNLPISLPSSDYSNLPVVASVLPQPATHNNNIISSLIPEVPVTQLDNGVNITSKFNKNKGSYKSTQKNKYTK